MTPTNIITVIIIGVCMALLLILCLCLFTSPTQDVVDKLTEEVITRHIKRKLKKKEKQEKSKRD